MSRMATTHMSTFDEFCALVESITADAPTGGAWLWKGDEVLVDAGYFRRLDTDEEDTDEDVIAEPPVTAQRRGSGLDINVGSVTFTVAAGLFRQAVLSDDSDFDDRELSVAMVGRLQLRVRLARAAPGLRAV